MPEKTTSNNSSQLLLLRPLALDPAHETELGLQNFLLLNERINSLPMSASVSLEAQIIERGVMLHYQLITGGGAVTSRPFELLENLSLEPDRALLGIVRLPKRRRRAGVTLLGANMEGRRLYLPARARCNLISFITFRLTKMGASAGDPLFPKLSGELIEKAAAEIVWLRGVKGKISWQTVLLAFIRYQLHIISDHIFVNSQKVKLSVSEFVELALHNLYHSEPPLVLELRRGSIGYASLPDAQFQGLFPSASWQLGKNARRGNRAAEAEIARIEEYYVAKLSHPVPAEQPEERSESTNSDRLNTTYGTLAAEKIRKLLKTIREGKSYAQAAKDAEAMLTHELFDEENAGDLRLLLLWLINKLKKKRKKGNKPKSVQTFSQLILFMIQEFKGESFTALTTEDLVIFLCQYGAADTARGYRTAAHDFHNFIGTQLKIPVETINWKNPALHFSSSYREWKLITEDEFQRLLANAHISSKFDDATMKIILLLLRRAGLRCSEVAQLTLGNFSFGISELTLKVQFSKSDAGRRSLPLYLLLSDEELCFVLDYLQATRKKAVVNPALLNQKLITMIGGTHPEPEQVGAEILRLCKAVDLTEHTAHGLRHAFASGLLAAWWLVLNMPVFESPEYSIPPAVLALSDFCRREIDGAPITYADDIRRLLGHSSLSVTFDRYIHVCDLIVAAQVQRAEIVNAPTFVSVNEAAGLTGLTARQVRYQLPPESRERKDRGAGQIDSRSVEEWLKNRLTNLER